MSTGDRSGCCGGGTSGSPPRLAGHPFAVDVSSQGGTPRAGTLSQTWLLTWLHPLAVGCRQEPLSPRWTPWGGDGPSPPSPVQVPEGDTHERNFGPVPLVPVCSAPAWSRDEGAASDLLLLLLLQMCQKAPAGRATPLPWLQSRVDTKNCGAFLDGAVEPQGLLAAPGCSVGVEAVLRAEDECGCASSLPRCPSLAVTPLPVGAGRD